MNHVKATASASTANDTKPKKPGDVKMHRLVIRPGKNNRARLHSNNVASTSTVTAATSTKFKILKDVKMKGPLHMEEKVENDRIGIHSKRFVGDVTNVASTSMATSVEPKSAPYKFKKAKTHFRNQVNGSAGKDTAVIKPAATRFNEGKKTVDKIKIRLELKDLHLRYVNAEGKPTCPICERNFESNIPLYQHMDLHSDHNWHTCVTSRIADLNINQSSENYNHEAALVDLTKCLSNWNIVRKKRSPLGSRPIEMDEDDMDGDACAAAETLMLMANDRFSKAKQPKTSMWTQMDREAAEGLLMFLGDHPHSPMGESSVQVPTSTTTQKCH
ncbi:zinc finger C2H2-type/integrase DNA-binding domain-containing protein [Tanacetum coccineum]